MNMQSEGWCGEDKLGKPACRIAKQTHRSSGYSSLNVRFTMRDDNPLAGANS